VLFSEIDGVWELAAVIVKSFPAEIVPELVRFAVGALIV